MEEEWEEQEPEGKGQKEGKERKGNPHYEMRSKSLMTLTDVLC